MTLAQILYLTVPGIILCIIIVEYAYNKRNVWYKDLLFVLGILSLTAYVILGILGFGTANELNGKAKPHTYEPVTEQLYRLKQ